MLNPSSNFITVNNTAARYPLDGLGAATATAASSLLLNAKNVSVDGFVVETADASASTITVMQQDGTTAILVIPIAAATAQGVTVSNNIPIGLTGLLWNAGISVKTSTANTTGKLLFRYNY